MFSVLFGNEEVEGILSDEVLIANMLTVESALARAQGALGVIPDRAAQEIIEGLENAKILPSDLRRSTTQNGLPVPALVAKIRADLPEGAGNWLHFGATSQDILDTAMVLRYRDCLDVIERDLDTVINGLREMSLRHIRTPMAGRTRTQIASPISFSLRVARWAQPLIELKSEIPSLRSEVQKIQFGGSVGSNVMLYPEGEKVAEMMAKHLGLTSAESWHSNRNGVMKLAAWLVRLGTALAKMAGDMIAMCRNESGEISIAAGGGSSTMPHKANPVRAEAVQTLNAQSRALLPALMAPHLEERDGANWALEWLVMPQIIITTSAALNHAIHLVQNLQPNAARMIEILDASGAMAETASYILAQDMPRAVAQAKVKEAGIRAKGEGISLAEALGIELNYERAIAAADATAARIFDQ